MQLGFVSAILHDLSLDEVLRFAAAAGYDCLEVMCWPKGQAQRRYAGVTHLDVSHFNEGSASDTMEMVNRHGVAISALGYYPNTLSPVEEEAALAVEHLRRVIEAAALLQINRVNTFIGRDWTRSVEDNWPRFLQTWEPIIHFAESLSVKVGIENCPMLFSKDEWPGGKNLAVSPAIWRRMFTDIPSPAFGLNFDPSHMVWQGMDYLKPLRDFAAHLFHVHAKDARIDRNRLDEVGFLGHPHDYHTAKLPGLGEVNWGRFFSVLSDTGYRGAVCVEVEDRAYEGSLATRKAALRQSHAYLRNFIPRGVPRD
ncbi:MAG: sugar phosphate isomerase/epimerase [Gemmataceae bacterium]|nr:sugar phosphate isomerase/epimerase [Gemmataceae bacterium]